MTYYRVYNSNTMDITSKKNDNYKRNIVPLNSFYIQSKSRRILYLYCKYYSYSINLYDKGDESTFLKDYFPFVSSDI